MILSQTMLAEHLRVSPECEWLCNHNIQPAEPGTPQYLCQSYFDGNRELQDCTCGECR